MSRRFQRVETSFWTDPVIASWDDDARHLALYLLTCPHRRAEGLFRLPMAYMLEDLGWTAQRLKPSFTELRESGFLEYDSGTSTCLLVRVLESQAPNPNQIKGCVAAVQELPDSPLKHRFYALCESHSPALAQALRESVPRLSGDASGTPLNGCSLSRTGSSSTSNSPAPKPVDNAANGDGGEVTFSLDELPRPRKLP